MPRSDELRTLTPDNPTPPPASRLAAKPTGGASNAGGRINRRLSLRLIGLSTTAILAAYTTGYLKTQPAEDQILALQQPQSTAQPNPSSTPAVLAAAAVVPTPQPYGTLTPLPTTGPSISSSDSATTPTVPTPIPPTPIPPTAIAPTATVPVRAAVSSTRRATPTTTTASAATAPSANPTSQVIVATSVPATPVRPTSTPVHQTATATTQSVVAASKYRDGTYVGTGNSRHGGVSVAVTIQGGNIVSAAITGSSTRYPISRIASLPPEVVASQGPPVDYVSGATDSSEAYIGAVRSALSQAT